jgi:hypothetical protein
VLAGLASCAGKPDDHTVNAEKAQLLGGQWPFSVASGVVACKGQRSAGVATFRPEGSDTVYALNGTAISAGYPRPDPIWLDDPTAPGLKISIGWLTDYALAICT